MSSLNITQQQTKRARELWWGLKGLDGAETAREELRVNGVSEHRISALYPVDFIDFIGGLLPVLAPWSLNYTSEDQLSDYFQIAEVLLDYSQRNFDLDIRQQLSDAMKSGEAQRKLRLLENHIHDCLPKEAGIDADDIATRIVYLLWYAISLYANIDELGALQSEVSKFLLDVTDAFLTHYDENYAQTVKPLQELLGSAS